MTAALHGGVAWSHVIRLPVLGVATTFATDSAAVYDAVMTTYGAWADLAAHPSLVTPSRATVKIALHDHPASPDRPTPLDAAPGFVYRVPDATRLLAFWSGGGGIADTTRCEALAYVTESLAARPAVLAESVLEPLTLFLLGALDRQPVHAAAVVRDGVAVLLSAPSGTGKSSVAYAACRHGYALLADEPVYVQLEPTLRVWGRRARLHLPVEARAHFPELRGVAPVRLPTGKTKIPVDFGDRAAPYADRAGLCLLRRAPGSTPSLERISPGRAAAEMCAHLDPGYDLFADTIGERIERIAGRGAWRLSLGPHPEDALPLLDEIAAELARAG
ncbi:MAG TPA: hypothetical protein VF158_10470 [Longimicrobiales bacterium]